ncbi:MAG TPA: hypothetical protein VFS55_15975 [Dokdonella sp.]|nr:hypothetical protein [Dokdonella sp.]
MPNYRRVWVPGGTCFFTVKLFDRRRRWPVDRIEDLRAAFRDAWAAQPFTIVAVVVLPDHLHCLWQWPPGDADNVRPPASVGAAGGDAPGAKHRGHRIVGSTVQRPAST